MVHITCHLLANDSWVSACDAARLVLPTLSNFCRRLGTTEVTREALEVGSRASLQAIPYLCDAFVTFSIRIAASLMGAAEAEASSAGERTAATLNLVVWAVAALTSTFYLLLKTKILVQGVSQNHAGRWSG